MKKIYLSLVLGICTLFSIGQGVTIGNGTVVSQAIPIEPYYGYSYSQQIYNSGLIQGSGTITSITFYCTSATDLTGDSDAWVVYMANTSKSSFSSTTDWEPLSSLTQVFSGTASVNPTGQVTIVLSTPFAYNGTGNLLIAVEENQAGYGSSSHDFYCTAMSSATAITHRSDITNADPANPPTATGTRNYLPNITLNGIQQNTCLAPSSILDSNTTSSSSDIYWSASSNETAWNVEWGVSGFTLGSGTSLIATDTTTSLSGLNSNTAYDFYVRAVCAAGDTSAWAGPFNFSTSCGSYTAPYSQNFDAVADPNYDACWSEILSSTSNFTRINSENFSGDPQRSAPNSIEFYSSSASVDDMLYFISPEFSDLDNSKEVRFYVQDKGFSSYAGNLIVGIMSDPSSESTFVPLDTVFKADLSSSWLEVIVPFTNYTGTGKHVALAYQVKGTYDYLWIDDFTYRATPTCFEPSSSSLVASNISSNSVDISWTPGANETSWQVQYDTAGFVPGTGTFAVSSNTTYSLTGLTAETSYDLYVRSLCAPGDTSAWSSISGFSTYGDCSSSGTYDYGNNEDASNATGFMANTPGDWITLDFTAGITESCCDDWYIMDSADGSGNIIATGNGSIVGTYTSTTGEISFFVDSDGSWSVVDGVGTPGVDHATFVYSASCSSPPACSAPSAFTATNVTTSSADLGWTAGTTASSFNLEYGATGFAMGSGTYMSGGTNPYAISGLMQGTSYDIYVQSVCSTGDSSAWAGPFTFSTSCGVNTAPWNESFSSAMPNCWSESGNMTALYNSGTVQTGDNWNFTNYNAYAGYYMHIGGNYQDLTTFPFGYCAFVNGNEGTGTYGPATLTTPEVSVVPITNPEVSFLLNSNRESDSVNAILDVEASNDGGTTWSSVASLQGNTNGWIRQHVSLSAYTGDTVQVRFVYSEPDTSGGTGSIAQLDHIAIDEITIGEAVTCFEISNLSLSNVTGSSVDLNWAAGGSEASWDILASSSSGNVSALSTDTTFTLTGLSGATNYDVYVRAVCGVGDTSVWYGPVSLFTYPDGPNGVTCGLGDTNATVFTDDCEDWTGWTGDFGSGNGIWRTNSGGTGSGGTGPSGAHEGSSYFYFEGSTGSSQFDTATIYSPLIDLSDAVGGSAELSFWLHAYGNNMGNLHVGASSTLTGTYTNLAIFSGQIQGSSALAYANLGVDLSAYVGDTVFLSFTYTRNPLGGFTQDLAIDLIEVNSCVVPPSHDMAIVAAAVASGCDLTTTEPIELWVVNNGLVAESSFDLSYAVNGGTPVVESITSTLNVGDTLMHVFAATADMSADGVYNLDFGLVLALDNDTSDNTMMLMAENYLTPAALTTMGDTICNGDTAMVSTTADGYAFWYDAATGGNLVGEDDVIYVTPSATTSYYAEDAVVIGHSEDFDSYSVGDYIVASDPSNWAVWPGGVPGGAYDMQITDVQGNGGNSLRVFNVDGTDVVMEFGEAIGTGRFYYSMDMYLVADGYINFQEDVVIGTEWNMSVTFIGGVMDIAIDGASVLTGSYTSTDPAGNTVWNNFEFECNYSTGLWEVFADGVSQGTFVNADPVASVNIYPGTGVEYYLDNVEWAAVTDDACRSERTEAIVTVNDCSNINELSFKDLSIYPNPNNGQFTITNSQEITELVITDLQGKVIYNNNNINLNKLNVELIDLERGMYMINIQTNDGMITKTVTIQ